MTYYRPISLLTVCSKVLKKANACVQTAYWSQNSSVLGKGYQLKMFPSN